MIVSSGFRPFPPLGRRACARAAPFFGFSRYCINKCGRGNGFERDSAATEAATAVRLHRRCTAHGGFVGGDPDQPCGRGRLAEAARFCARIFPVE